MPLSNPDLWHRLAAFEFDEPGVPFPYSKRLARDCGWSHAYALRVVEEYRRLLYLAFAAGHPVTPSIDVDEAWHLHLTYTRSYWDELCGDVLGAPLHHDPTVGGVAEAARFDDWYARTLESYEREFDGPSPGDIWPSRTVRFDPAQQPRRVTRRTHIVLARARIRAALPFVAVLALFAAVLAPIAGCGREGDMISPAVWVIIAAVLILLFALNQSRGRKRNRRRGHGGQATGEAGGIMYWGDTHGWGSDDGGGSSWGDSGGDAGGADSTGSGCGGCGGGGD